MRATVLGAAEDVDVAVLAVERELPNDWLSWVDPEELQVGEEVVALGYPVPDFVFSARPSTVVSFKGVGRTRDALLLDGLVDRGNSGGPYSLLTPSETTRRWTTCGHCVPTVI